jgi:NADH:ubiquinone oxidoreductase subunit 6 (chain J)
MTVQMIFLAFFGGAAVWFGVVVFRTHSMVRSALALLFSQTAIGAMFLVMQAEFLGVLQIMMMATEMSVMAIFMVMFMMDPGGMGKNGHDPPETPVALGRGHRAAGRAVAGLAARLGVRSPCPCRARMNRPLIWGANYWAGQC